MFTVVAGSLIIPGAVGATAVVKDNLDQHSGLLKTLVYQRSDAAMTLLTHQQSVDQLVTLVLITVPLFMLYGACMGLPGGLRQTIASAVKTPLIFLCTLIVCFPVLAILAILMGLNLGIIQTATLVMMSLLLNSLLLACFAPLCAFFAISSDYHFTKLLHLTVFAMCGIFSTAVLFQSLQIVVHNQGLESESGMLLFLCWMITYAFVGLQMAWTLRPMIGDPGLPFQWIRRRTAGMSVYTAISYSIEKVGKPGAATDASPSSSGEDLFKANLS